jgi:hypothetical protein
MLYKPPFVVVWLETIPFVSIWRPVTALEFADEVRVNA